MFRRIYGKKLKEQEKNFSKKFSTKRPKNVFWLLEEFDFCCSPTSADEEEANR